MTDNADRKKKTAKTIRKPTLVSSRKAATKKHKKNAEQYSHIYPVILAGGSGIRLWPESTPDCPKQFLPISGKRTMLEQTFQRITPLATADHVFVVTSKKNARQVTQCLPNVAMNHVLTEPVGRNTAPAIGLAAMEVLKCDPDAVMVVLPSDHMVEPVSEFGRAIDSAMQTVKVNPDRLVVFGIAPTCPATQFGYIEIKSKTDALTDSSSQLVHSFAVSSFHEKPDRKTAAKYLKTKRFYWNSGMFVWRADRILELLKQFEPELFVWLERISTLRHLCPDHELPYYEETLRYLYESVKKIPIDRAVLERANDLYMVEASFHWDDLGSFTSLAACDGHTDENENIITGEKIVLHHATQNIVRQYSGQSNPPLVALLGVKDLIVVQTPGAILVCKKEEQTNIPELLEKAGISFEPDKVSRSW